MEEIATKVFSREEIVEFCMLTGDSNELHNPQVMGENYKKEPIVPGMQVFATTLAMLQDSVEVAKNFNLVFGMPTSALEELTLNIEYEQHPFHAKLSANKNGRNILSAKDKFSSISEEGKEEVLIDGGRNFSLYLDHEKIKSFGELIGTKRKNVRDFSYSMALASYALLYVIKEKRQFTDKMDEKTIRQVSLENEINNMMYPAKGEPIFPVYASLSLNAPRGMQELKSGFLEFRTEIEEKVKKKNYEFFVKCSQDSKELYNGIFQLTAIPMRILRRSAKDSTAQI